MKSIFFIFLLVVGCVVAVGLTREYVFFRASYSSSAQSYCRQYYRDLATITSKEESKQLLQSGLSNYDRTITCGNAKSFYCDRFLILVKEKKTWEEAQEFCRTNYTSLASVTSETSLSQLNLETVGTETESVWTGLRFMNGQWFWVSGEQLGSLVSMPSCPALSYRCGALNTTTNTLQNLNCNEKLNFVCYWN
ncbi:hypothetical protein Q7C36_010113 [Tachysurus vachellii]|uniref:C-type lectin domain-containing protein n=1 Tax=Tachysurus vachellii TaxID=175792 RepID=A0AA88SWG4_TACVA|nr:hypothetical protein Q7C36_010113 [Tachysurus vachellii]